MTMRDPEGVVTHLEALQSTEGQEDTVRVVIYLRTAAAFEVQQDNDGIRLAIAQPSPVRAAARAPVSPGAPTGLAAVSMPTSAHPDRRAISPVAAKATGIVAQVAPGTRQGAAAAAAPGGAGLTEPPVFTGEKISLDFQDADINDILRLIAEVGGVNIIAGGDVQGKVTTRMVDVPWDQALDVILKINGLTQERSGNIIRVVPLTKFTQERQERLQAQKTEVEAEPLVTRVVPVNYAVVKDLLEKLKTLLTPVRGKILIDERTNTIILTDTQRQLENVLALIERLDRPTPQVMIEARIVESSRDFTRELGIQLGLAYSQITDRTFPNRIDIRGGLPNTPSNSGGLTPPRAPANFLLDLPAAVALGNGGAIGFSLASIGGAILDAQLSALERSGRGKIISSPKIATLDNTEAQIQSGRTFYVQTTSAEGTKTQPIDATIILKVIPHVTPSDFIGMKITATKNDADFGTVVNGIPTVTKREANTDMLVKDGDTVVIGGLYSRTIATSRAGLPGLSSLPVLGWLFRKDTETDTSNELLIFLTPRIIRQDNATAKRSAALSY
jgi:type IV pilus assembly protein PilQ